MLEAVAWIVHPAAGLALALFASVLFSRRGRQWEAVAFASALLLLLAILGAGWDVHPAAGMLLGYFGSTAYGNWHKRWPALLAALAASGLFMLGGAGWMVYPLAVMGLIWLFTAAFSFMGRGAKTSGDPQMPAELPEHARGFSFGPWFGEREKEAVPAAQAQGKVPLSKTAAPTPDAYADWMRDSRLPGEARAQLIALDLRTKEALTHLHGLGQQGSESQFSEAQYLARAIREEYVPTAVNAYLKLPRTRADTAIIEDGKTGRDLLREQLDLLLDAVQGIIDTTLMAGGREMLTHKRFLEDRFGKSADARTADDLKV
ncbi:MFS transporter [Deinococcus saxicola]